MKSAVRIVVKVQNTRDTEALRRSLDSLTIQSLPAPIIVASAGANDSSTYSKNVTLLRGTRNKARGLNEAIRKAMASGAEFVALFSTDIVADPHCLQNLIEDLMVNDDAGIATCKILEPGQKCLDSTGGLYTIWGLPSQRGQGELVSDTYDDQVQVFAGSGKASLYRISMLREIGLFDEDFSAYYDDVDLSFRAQLAGWKVRYVPEALAYHQTAATNRKARDFIAKQTVKNLPWLLWKNAPLSVLLRVLPRFTVAYYSFIFTAAWRDQGGVAMLGFWKMWILLPKKTIQRWHIQHRRRVTASYIWASMAHELPLRVNQFKTSRKHQ